MVKILISAIEVSGDMHAANLVATMRGLRSDLEFVGLGSEKLVAQGMRVIADVTARSTVGMIEPLKHIGAYLRVLKQLKKCMREERPDLLLLVDGQGFNMPVASAAKVLGIPVVYYIAPQEWLWGTVEGGQKVAALCTKIISIFPEEATFYNKLGVAAVYNGHPLTDIVQPTKTKAAFCAEYDLAVDRPIVALFPGSRQQELKLLMPILIAMTKKVPVEVQWVIAAANNHCYMQMVHATRGTTIPIVSQDNYNLMAAADLIVSSTGTITLEAALIGTPLMAIYKLSAFSYWLAKTLFGSRLPQYMALPNMLSHKKIMPEYIQKGVEPQYLADRVTELLKTPERMAEIKNNFTILKQQLQRPDVLMKNAQDVLAVLEK